MRRVPSLILASPVMITALLWAAGCEDSSLCPYPNASAVQIVPAAPCLTASVDTCIDPTLIVKNGCNTALYLPTEYGRFGPDGAVGADVEILVGQTARYVIKPDKAKSTTTAEKTWVIPARIGTDKIEFRFSTLTGG